MNQVTLHEDPITKGLVDLENTKKLCNQLMQTAHYAKLGQEGIYAVVAKAKALNIDPFDALNGALYFVKGKVGMSTEQMACLVRQAGHSVVKDPKSTNTNCILHGKRKDNGDTWTVSFSIDDAKRAGIYKEKSPWESYPSVMCYNRAMSMLFRQLFPDLSKGAGYTMDELNEIASHKDIKHEVLQEATVEEVMPKITQEQANELRSLWSRCDASYVEKVKMSLAGMSFREVEELTPEVYDRVKAAAIKNARADIIHTDEEEVINA